jgi:ATP-dependent Lon protease
MYEELNNKLRTVSIEELKQIIALARMPADVQNIADMELDALSTISSGTVKYESGLNCIGYLISLPWNERTGGNTDIQRIEAILNEKLHCSQNIKDRILRHLAVKLLNDERKPKILVVDDEKVAIESLEHILVKEGYNVVTARNGAEAIEELKASDIDVVITDLIMGEVDGHAVLKETRSKYPDTQVIMITGYATVDNAVEAIRMGAFHYIEKPIRLDEVRKTVKDVLMKRSPGVKRTILCFSGPSDSEKTLLGETIAEVLDKKFIRISLAGMEEGADIRGQSRTIDGAKPGCIIEEIRGAGVADPVIMLDGLDMEGQDFRSDFISALLEVLDPVKNRNFTDRYLNVPFNLSSIFFIVMANNADNIPDPVSNLLEIIEF